MDGDEVVARLVVDPWSAAPPAPPGMSPDEALHRAIAAVADALDSRGPLAPDWVNEVPLEVVEQAFSRVLDDRITLEQHRPVDGTCPVDGEGAPCGVVRGLLERYAVTA